MRSLIHDTLVHDKVRPALVKPLLTCFRNIQPESEQRVVSLVEIISEIRQPIETPQEVEINAEAQRQLDIKVL